MSPQFEAMLFTDQEAQPISGEEESNGKYTITDEPTWVCDPVDGTANFLHGIELTCVCVGLVVKKQPLVGVVYNPVSKELFSAVDGGGPYLTVDGASPTRIRPSAVAQVPPSSPPSSRPSRPSHRL